MIVYVDANPYIDVFEDRKDPLRDLAELSFQMFRRIRERKYELVVSDWLETEINNNKHLKEYTDFIKMLESDGVKIIRIETTPEDKDKARMYRYKRDALHAVLAAKAKADVLVTNNIEDYFDLQKMIRICLPREL